MTEEALVATEEIAFDTLTIGFDSRILTPRPWTVLQSRWAAELLPTLPDGPVLELCCGAGHIGLAAVVGSTRALVCVDRDPVAVDWASQNAVRAGLAERVEVRRGEVEVVVGAEERYALVVADPPWVPSAETGRWPEDPLGAIDGGADGLDVARRCLQVATSHLLPGGAVLLQLGNLDQVDALRAPARDRGLPCVEICPGERGVVALFTASS
jgi:methylase of polypeptide subunit release factors